MATVGDLGEHFSFLRLLRRFDPTAGATMPLIAIKQGVGFVVGMARRTVGLSSIDASESITALNVNLQRDGFKVVEADARPVAAEVVKRKSVWNRADDQLIAEAVGEDHPSSALEMAVAAAQGVSRPYPAGFGKLNLAPKPLLNAQLPVNQGIAVAEPALTVHGAPAASTRGLAALRDATIWLHRKITSFVARRRGAHTPPSLSFYRSGNATGRTV